MRASVGERGGGLFEYLILWIVVGALTTLLGIALTELDIDRAHRRGCVDGLPEAAVARPGEDVR
jgi:hypothetical protein